LMVMFVAAAATAVGVACGFSAWLTGCTIVE
jgi:hypothetical protein